MSQRQYSKICLLLALVFAVSACKITKDTGQKNENIPLQNGKLVFGLLPTDDNYEQEKHINGLVQYLSEKTGLEVTYRHEIDYYIIVEDMQTELIDISFTGPLAYIMAHDVAHAEVLVTTAHPDGKLNTYKSVFITHSDSKIKTLDQYIKQFDSLKTAFVDPFSVTGSVIPSAKLMEEGIRVGQGHPSAIFEGSHRQAIDSLIAKSVDVAAVSDMELEAMIQEKKIKRSDFRILWESNAIPPVPIFVRENMDKILKTKLIDAFLSLPDEKPDIHKSFSEMWGKDLIFVKANNQMYEPIKEISKYIHHHKK